MADCHYKRKNTQGKLLKKERKNKILILSLGLGRRRVFFLAWLRGRSIFGFRINLFGFGLCLLRLYCNILGFLEELGLLTLALILVYLSLLALISSLAGSFGSFEGGKRGLSSQGLLGVFWSEGRRRWKGSWGFADARRIVHIPSLPPL